MQPQPPPPAEHPPLVLRAASDLHLSEKTAPYVFAALREMREDAMKHKGYTIFPGDIFNVATVVHMPTFLALRTMLQTWPDEVIVLPGNHDQWAEGPGGNICAALQGGKCRVYSTPAWTQLGRFIPYTPPKEFAKALTSEMPPVGGAFMLPIVWCHHGFMGAYRNAMSMDSDGVSCQDIPEGHLVVTGHYHMPQTLGRVIYCGSPYQTSFAEEGQEKGWLRWENAHKDLLPQRIAFGDLGAPKHVTVHWDPTKGAPTVPAAVTANDVVRVRTPASRDDAKLHAAQLASVGLSGAPVLAKQVTAARIGATFGGTVQEQVERYVGLNSDKGAELLDFAEEVGLWE